MTTKTTKQPRKQASTERNTAAGVLQELVDTLAMSVRALREEIEALIAGRAKETAHDRGSRIAYLSQKAGSIADTLRKIQAADKRATENLDPQAVNAYLRAMPAAEWNHLRRELDQHHRGGSVLG